MTGIFEKFTSGMLVLILISVLVLVPATVASATPIVPVDSGSVVMLAPARQADVDFNALLASLLAMGGFASLVAVLINVGKSVGIVQDGTAKTWAAGLNLIGLAGLYLLQVFRPDVPLEQVDGVAGSLAQVFVVVLAFVVQLGITVGANGVVKTLPLIGFSHSDEQAPLKAQTE